MPLLLFLLGVLKMVDCWGWHTIFDCSDCDQQAMTDRKTVYDFAKQLVVDIDMIAFGEPMIYNFGSGDKEGFTLVQLIETSDITAHFADEKQAIFIDVFSCKKYDVDVVKDLIEKTFKPKKILTRSIERSI